VKLHCNEAHIIVELPALRKSLHLFDELVAQLKSGQSAAPIHRLNQAPIVIDVSGPFHFKQSIGKEKHRIVQRELTLAVGVDSIFESPSAGPCSPLLNGYVFARSPVL